MLYGVVCLFLRVTSSPSANWYPVVSYQLLSVRAACGSQLLPVFILRPFGLSMFVAYLLVGWSPQTPAPNCTTTSKHEQPQRDRVTVRVQTSGFICLSLLNLTIYFVCSARKTYHRIHMLVPTQFAFSISYVLRRPCATWRHSRAELGRIGSCLHHRHRTIGSTMAQSRLYAHSWLA